MATEAELFIVVLVAGQHLGLSARQVLKVIEVGPIARLARLPRAVVGITPYRGRIITVLDLAVIIGQEREQAAEQAGQRIVILDSGSRNVGLLVDSVEVISTVELAEQRRGVSEDDVVVEMAVHGDHAMGLIDGQRLSKLIAGLCPS